MTTECSGADAKVAPGALRGMNHNDLLLNFTLHRSKGDGRCGFLSIARAFLLSSAIHKGAALRDQEVEEVAANLRLEAANYIQTHRAKFSPFFEEGALKRHVDDLHKNKHAYIEESSIKAISELYGLRIVIVCMDAGISQVRNVIVYDGAHRRNGVSRCVYLRLTGTTDQNQHYDLLVPRAPPRKALRIVPPPSPPPPPRHRHHSLTRADYCRTYGAQDHRHCAPVRLALALFCNYIGNASGDPRCNQPINVSRSKACTSVPERYLPHGSCRRMWAHM